MLFKQECKKKLLRKPTYVIVRGGRKFCGWETGEEPDDPVTSATDLRDLGKPMFPRSLTNSGCLFLGHSVWDQFGRVFSEVLSSQISTGLLQIRRQIFQLCSWTSLYLKRWKSPLLRRGWWQLGLWLSTGHGAVIFHTSWASVLALPDFFICRIFNPEQSVLKKNPAPRGVGD